MPARGGILQRVEGNIVRALRWQLAACTRQMWQRTAQSTATSRVPSQACTRATVCHAMPVSLSPSARARGEQRSPLLPCWWHLFRYIDELARERYSAKDVGYCGTNFCLQAGRSAALLAQPIWSFDCAPDGRHTLHRPVVLSESARPVRPAHPAADMWSLAESCLHAEAGVTDPVHACMDDPRLTRPSDLASDASLQFCRFDRRRRPGVEIGGKCAVAIVGDYVATLHAHCTRIHTMHASLSVSFCRRCWVSQSQISRRCGCVDRD